MSNHSRLKSGKMLYTFLSGSPTKLELKDKCGLELKESLVLFSKFKHS